MSSVGRDWGDILSRLNVSWGVKQVANIMSILNKRTTPIEEDEALIRHIVYSPLIDLHTNTNTSLSIDWDMDESVDVDGYSGWGYRKWIPTQVRPYDITHDHSNEAGITYAPPGITQFDATTKGRKFMGAAVSNGAGYSVINGHSHFSVNDFTYALWLNIPATETGDGGKNIIAGDDNIRLWTLSHGAGGANANRLSFQHTHSGGTASYIMNYTPDTWFSVIVHVDATNWTIYIDNVLENQESSGGVINPNEGNIGLFAHFTGSSPAKSGVSMAWLTILDKDVVTDSQWRTDYHTNGLIDLEDASSTEITTIPMIGSMKPMPNAYAGMFYAN